MATQVGNHSTLSDECHQLYLKYIVAQDTRQFSKFAEEGLMWAKNYPVCKSERLEVMYKKAKDKEAHEGFLVPYIGVDKLRFVEWITVKTRT